MNIPASIKSFFNRFAPDKSIKSSSNDYESYWNNKRPKAEITYLGRYIPFSKTDQKIAVPVQVFITPNDPVIISDLQQQNLMILNPDKCNDLILKIYKYTRVKKEKPFKYASDQSIFGVPEIWCFPFETRYLGKGDCLPGDTLLLKDKYSFYAIKDIEIGDKVYGKTGFVEVTNKWNKGVLPIIGINLSNGSMLRCTKDHKLILEDGTIKLAGDIKIGDILLSPDKLISGSHIDDCVRGGNTRRDKVIVRDIIDLNEDECFDIETNDSNIYLPEYDIIVHNCDDYAIELVSYLRAAGLPAFRVRCVAGMTRSGFGHATVYVLADDMQTWKHCFEAGTGVITDEGIKNIEDIDIGDKVLSINNRWDTVENVHKLYTNTITSINNSAFYENINSTPEHKYLVIKRMNVKKGRYVPGLTGIKDIKKAEWIRASDIRKGDLLISNINNEVLYNIKGNDFAYLLGQYLGDGNLVHRKRFRKRINKQIFEPSGIRFIKNKNEVEIIDKIKNKLKLFSNNKISQNIINDTAIISISDVKLAKKIIAYCGYAKHKKIGKEILFLSVDEQKSFLLGIIESDGSKSKHRDVDCLKIVQSRIHKDILKGLLFILKRLRIRYNISSKYNTKATFKQNDKIVNIDIRGLDLTTWEQTQRNGNVNYIDGYCISFVKSVNTINKETEVYDLTTKETHTYNAEGFIVHNCNSTTPAINLTIEKLINLPTTKDKWDDMGIKDVWFSFNDINAWSVFETESASESFEQEPRCKNISIIIK